MILPTNALEALGDWHKIRNVHLPGLLIENRAHCYALIHTVHADEEMLVAACGAKPNIREVYRARVNRAEGQAPELGPWEGGAAGGLDYAPLHIALTSV